MASEWQNTVITAHGRGNTQRVCSEDGDVERGRSGGIVRFLYSDEITYASADVTEQTLSQAVGVPRHPQYVSPRDGSPESEANRWERYSKGFP